MKINDKIKAFICGVGGIFDHNLYVDPKYFKYKILKDGIAEDWKNVGSYLWQAMGTYDKTDTSEKK